MTGLNGVLKEIAEHLGDDAALKVADLFGGTAVYIPLYNVQRRKRDEALMHGYASGLGLKRLASMYRLTERQIRRIVKSSI